MTIKLFLLRSIGNFINRISDFQFFRPFQIPIAEFGLNSIFFKFQKTSSTSINFQLYNVLRSGQEDKYGRDFSQALADLKIQPYSFLIANQERAVQMAGTPNFQKITPSFTGNALFLITLNMQGKTGRLNRKWFYHIPLLSAIAFW